MTEETAATGATLRVTRGDITLMEVDAFVFYAQPSLQLGTGYGNAIAVRGGPAIQQELDALAPRETCEVVISDAGKLPAKYILHAVGPRFQEEGLAEKLRTTTLNALKLADEKGIERIAFPLMGRGFYGVPFEESARLTVETIQKHIAGSTGLQEVFVCVNDSFEMAKVEALL
jgi:O-acetyl-ADP-ribose deacetylase (regulator of RNase III)